MRAHRTQTAALAAVTALLLTGGLAGAATIATFADPASSGDTPLFEVNVQTHILKGGWDGSAAPELILQVPFTSHVYSDATFTLTDLIFDPNDGVTLGGGSIVFRDHSNSVVLTITFASARMFPGFGFGASDLIGNNVAFTGPGIPAGLTQNQFAFSFANPVPTAAGYTYTASFTSSAVPEPASFCLAALGLAGLVRRR